MIPLVHDLIDGLDVLICGLDDDGRIHIFNRPCERLTGLARADVLGTSWLDLFSQERVEHVTMLWRQARRDAPAGPYEALCRNGRNVRWQFSRWDAPLPPVSLWAVGIDMTDEREALVRARELERIVSIGNLVSGLTHELRNPLNGALLQLTVADRVLARIDGTAAAAAAIVQARSEMRRISGLLDDFLVFVRPMPVHLERDDVRQIVTRAIARGAHKSRAAGVAVELEPGCDVFAEVDPSRLEGACYQLLANAIDAAIDAPVREVRVRVGVDGNTFAIEVEDGGPGLSSDAPLFEPFFTTKGGTGLGLAIVQRVATDHGGNVFCQRRDRVTVFRLVLPIVAGVAN